MEDESNSKQRNEEIEKTIQSLPPENVRVLAYLLAFLHKVVDNADKNKMSASNLGIIFAAVFAQPRTITIDALNNKAMIQLVTTFIEHGRLSTW